MSAKAKHTAATARIDVVFIRKSSAKQDESGQVNNVRAMLKARSAYIPDANWFVGTIGRRKVKANAEFIRLMELVEADRVGTVYIESQDRWGTGDRPELFNLLGTLRDHSTRLFDLRDGKDLTEKDFSTELLAFVNSIKSEKELLDISYRSLRTRVNNFKDTGSWPTGTHPYGYGKECRSADGRLLWVWQPVNRSTGQLFFPGPDGALLPGPENVAIPRKSKGDIIKLIPSNNPDFVRAVQLIFDLYTRVGLSRRAISARLNGEGLTFNGGPFGHQDITHILQNPAYAGDTHFGKVQTGELHTFDDKGLIVPIKAKREGIRRDVSQHIVKRDTHEALVDRATWDLAAKKLAAEQERTSYAPRNPAYFLKQLFVCGHCGKGMTGRCEKNPETGVKKVVYVCATYTQARCGGFASPCGYQRISHEDAERLLLDKIAELGLPYDAAASDGARSNLQARLERLGIEGEESARQWEQWLHEGINAFADYLIEEYGVAYPVLPTMRKWALNFYCEDDNGDLSMARVSKELSDLRTAIRNAEEMAVEEAGRKLAELEAEHTAYTRAWVKAISEMQQAVLKKDIERLESEITLWKPRTVPLSERFKEIHEAEAERKTERDKLRAEWPTLEDREKGEAMRRLFNTVTLFWEVKHHAPARTPPCRPRKTNRRGRKSYTLLRDKIQWSLAECGLASSW